MTRDQEEARARAVEVLSQGRAVVLAGPGLLSCAGLTAPEAPGGVWDEDPARCATAEAFGRWPERAWGAWGAWRSAVDGALGSPSGPSRAHGALRALAEASKVRGVISTTTDGLARRSGGGPVAELFGAVDRLRCAECGARREAPASVAWASPPMCGACGGALRPDMVLFGEAMPRGPREQAAGWVYGGRSLLVLGVDLTRPPIHRIPEEMFQEGGVTIAIGQEVEVGAVRRVRGVMLEGDIEAVLPALVQEALGASWRQ